MAYWLGRVGHAGLRLVAPLLMVVAAAVVLVLLAQNGIVVAPAAMRPDWSRLNPATGVKRLFSLQTLLDTGKTLLKLTAYSLVCVWVLDGLVRTWAQADLAAGALARAGSVACLQLLLALLGVTAVFAALDQLLARKMFARQMRMSPHEIKQEFKQREGDPRIKQRREQLQRELLQRAASARGVRGADVVITNPTHYLVGLKYERGRMAAPKVVARGQGNVALRLRAIAFRHGVPIVASPLLARQLFRGVRQDDEIPPALFSQVVAVYLKLRLPPR
jgi:flagellar biosynthetic protein FlhB